MQGSSIGPRLFNLYLNDITSCSKFYTVLFADDTNLLLSRKDPKELETVANEEMLKVLDYFRANGLTVSTLKTSFIHFKPKGKSKANIKLKIGKEDLKEVTNLTFLGVLIDNKLSFKSHFDKVYKKASHGLRGLILVKKFLTYKAKLAIYHSLIHSHLSYCSLIWLNNIKKSQLNLLIKLQKKAIRAIFNARFNTHTSKFFEYCGITRVENIFYKESILITHKFHNNALPRSIQELFTESVFNPSLITRSMINCVMQPKRDINGLTMFEIIDNWNRLGYSMRQIKSFKELKNRISKLLNSKYEGCNKHNCYSCNYDYSKIPSIIRS